MFDLFRKKRIKKYEVGACVYVSMKYEDPIHFIDDQINDSDIQENSGVRYSSRSQIDVDSRINDNYDVAEVSRILRKYSRDFNYSSNSSLKVTLNLTFVERLLIYISEKGLRDSEVYKDAQIDKRLFSKMVSNREYKPSKDTAVALSLALRLSLEEANDLLSRAGYTLSHSNKRDVIIEFFFREQIYNLIDANEVLDRLGQKIIGRV